ncbi:MAG: hypothetical protein AABX28_01800 [Nanoarchaeota archaeon]
MENTKTKIIIGENGEIIGIVEDGLTSQFDLSFEVKPFSGEILKSMMKKGMR